MERPNVPQALGIARKLGWQFDIMSTTFFVSRRKLRPAARSRHAAVAGRLFISLARTPTTPRIISRSDGSRGRGGYAGDDLERMSNA